MELKKVIVVEYYAGVEQEFAIVRDGKNPQANPTAYDSLQKLVDDLRATK